MIPSDEQVEESRRRLDIPQDWEWYSCANLDCTDIVWCPPGVGDLAIRPVCSTPCAIATIGQHQESP